MLLKRIILSTVILFATVFVLFMSFTLYSEFLLGQSDINERALTALVSTARDALTGDKLRMSLPTELAAPQADESGAATDPTAPVDITRRALLLCQSENDSDTGLLEEWCVYGKYRYCLETSLPDAAVASRFDLLLFGSYAISAKDLPTLRGYAQSGVTMIFTRLPAFDTLVASEPLADFFGIDKAVRAEYPINGAYLYDGFLISRARIYTHGDFYGYDDDMELQMPYYTLREGYDVYMAAILDDQQKKRIVNEELPALLWRTVTGNSQVFVVNTELFSDEALLGVITAFVSQSQDSSIYPIVNAKTINVLNYPWVSIENETAIEGIYGRRPDTLSSDIIWPAILQILYSYDEHAGFCISSQYDYSLAASESPRLPKYYSKQIRKLIGAMSLTLDQRTNASLDTLLEMNRAFFAEAMPDFSFTSVYSGKFDPAALLPYIGREGSVLERVSLILSEWKPGDRIISYQGEDALSVKLTTNGFDYEARDDMRMISYQTALGMSNQYVDMSRTLYPATDEDMWNKQSIVWSSGITYFREFEALDYVTVYEMEDRIRNFLSLDYSVRREGDLLHIGIDAARPETYFILRIFGKRLVGVEGGTATRLTDTAYLINAAQSEVTIELEPLHSLAVP